MSFELVSRGERTKLTSERLQGDLDHWSVDFGSWSQGTEDHG